MRWAGLVDDVGGPRFFRLESCPENLSHDRDRQNDADSRRRLQAVCHRRSDLPEASAKRVRRHRFESRWPPVAAARVSRLNGYMNSSAPPDERERRCVIVEVWSATAAGQIDRFRPPFDTTVGGSPHFFPGSSTTFFPGFPPCTRMPVRGSTGHLCAGARQIRQIRRHRRSRHAPRTRSLRRSTKHIIYPFFLATDIIPSCTASARSMSAR